MRARLGIASSSIKVELREILLRDKPAAFLTASPSATVPCLDLGAAVIDESLDIMIWALEQNDPENLLIMPEDGHALIMECDGPFKAALDRYKYSVRYEGIDPKEERAKASAFVRKLDAQLGQERWLFGEAPKLADFAILPFVRQFAHVDLVWFESEDWRNASRWLSSFKESERFARIMRKYAPWQSGEIGPTFPES